MDVGRVISEAGSALLGAVIGGPGGLVSGAARMVGDAFNVSPEQSDQLVAAIKSNSEASIMLKRLEQEHEQYLIAARQAQDQMAYADIQSARNREIEVSKSTGKADKNITGLAWVNTFCFYVGIIALIWVCHDNPGPVLITMASSVLGVLGTNQASIIGYFFGSSSSSASKNETLAQLASSAQKLALPVAPASVIDIKSAPLVAQVQDWKQP